jgi:quinolinate synthase
MDVKVTTPRTLDSRSSLAERILKLKQEKNAVILAHYYQEPDIQDIADFIGDSLGLSQKAATVDADIIVFAGVHFMGETAKIINPSKKVLIPDMEAGCSLADSAPTKPFKAFTEAHPDHIVVTYINCSAEIKALSDIVCTSSNAQKIIESIPMDRPIIFAPDKNLGLYLQKVTGREMLLWDGSCIVHEAFSLEKIIKLRKEHPKAIFIAHPESEPHILRIAQFIGSTAGMIKYVRDSEETEFIVATEHGILHQMQKEVPNKKLIPAPAKEDNTCACSECAYMKMNTLQKIYDCLLNENPSIEIGEELREKARVPIERMLELSK